MSDPAAISRPRNLSLYLVALFFAIAIASLGALLLRDRQLDAEQQALADLIGEQLAQAAAPMLLNDDLLSLQALLSELNEDQRVLHIAIHNTQNELLSQSGRSREATIGIQVRSTISFQSRLLGYARLSLAEPKIDWLGSTGLGLMTLIMSIGGLLISLRQIGSHRRDDDARPAPKLSQDRFSSYDYRSIEHSDVVHGIVAVELLQLQLMRRQLSEDMLYEYLATFEQWLQSVADLYDAQIRVGETGFTLSLKDQPGNEEADKLAARVCQCSLTLSEVLRSANQTREASSEPVFEARMGAHLSAPLQTEARLLRELYSQDTHRQAWQACIGRAAGSVTITQSVLSASQPGDLSVSSQDANGYYELLGLNAASKEESERSTQSVLSTAEH